jgi:hypothetical protein
MNEYVENIQSIVYSGNFRALLALIECWKMKELSSFETLRTINGATQSQIPKDLNPKLYLYFPSSFFKIYLPLF